MRPAEEAGIVQPVLAGIVTAVVGFSGAFAVVLSGLRAVGATPEQAASGLLVLCVTMGIAAIVLSVRSRMPISIAAVSAGVAHLVLGAAVGLATALADAAPPGLIEAVAGVALLATLGSALAAAAAEPAYRDAAIVTFVVSASAITVVGVSAPFWRLVAGLAVAATRPAARTPA